MRGLSGPGGAMLAAGLVLAAGVALPVLLLAPGDALAQTAPFRLPASEPPPAPTGGWLDGVWSWIRETQAALHRELVAAVRLIRDQDVLAGAWTLVLVSAFYGVVHAAGPGHGKTVVGAYMLAEGRTVRRGLIIAFLSAMMQAVTAVVLVGALVLIFRAASAQITETAGWLEKTSYLLVVCLGLWLSLRSLLRLARRLRPAPTAHGHDTHDHGAHCHDCGHAHLPDAHTVERAETLGERAALIFSIGLRPCTGAILVLIFAAANDMFWAGVLAAFAMALGTAVTVSALAVGAVGLRAGLLRGAGGRWGAVAGDAMALAGSVLILAIGLALLTAPTV